MTHRELVQKVLRDPVHWPAFGFGLGLAPKAPGTFGSLLGLPIWWFSWSYGLTVYLLLALFVWPAAVLVLIGLLDAIFDFRGRAGPPPAAPKV